MASHGLFSNTIYTHGYQKYRSTCCGSIMKFVSRCLFLCSLSLLYHNKYSLILSTCLMPPCEPLTNTNIANLHPVGVTPGKEVEGTCWLRCRTSMETTVQLAGLQVLQQNVPGLFLHLLVATQSAAWPPGSHLHSLQPYARLGPCRYLK